MPINDEYADKIRNRFPYPIVSSFNKLRTDECLDPGDLRLRYILSTSECISCFLGVMVLCECRELLEKKVFPPSGQMFKNFSENFKKPTWGNWISFLREGLKWLHDNKASTIMPELYEFYFKKNHQESDSARNLNKLLTIRNKVAHHMTDPAHKLGGLCEETDPLLDKILEDLKFLLNYELTFISQIEALKERRNNPKFRHHFKKIIGISEAFPANREIRDDCLDSKVIVIMNQETEEYVNLDPLIIYEGEAGNIPDIFFYSGMNNSNSAIYRPCKHAEVFESTKSSRSELIAEELQHMISLFEIS